VTTSRPHPQTVPTTQRVLTLLDLLQRRTTWTGPELAEELGVTTRCVRRDVDRLRELGYPVDSERGAAGGYRLGPGRRLPPLLLDDREAVAVALALRLVAGHAVSDTGEPALRALTKLDQVMPPRLAERVAAVAGSTTTVTGPAAEVDPDLLLDLGRAIRGTERVRLDYTTGEGASGERSVEPYRVVVLGFRWYLLAFDLDRGDWRTFRLDRMAAVRRTGWRYAPRTDVSDAAERVRRSVTTDRYAHRVRVRVAADAAEVAALFPPTYATVSPLPPAGDGDDAGGPAGAGGSACLVETGADDVEVLAWHLARIPADFRVEGDPAVVAAIRTLGERLTAAAGAVGEPEATEAAD